MTKQFWAILFRCSIKSLVFHSNTLLPSNDRFFSLFEIVLNQSIHFLFFYYFRMLLLTKKSLAMGQTVLKRHGHHRQVSVVMWNFMQQLLWMVAFFGLKKLLRNWLFHKIKNIYTFFFEYIPFLTVQFQNKIK